MFERFAEHARRAVVLAGDEARALRHSYIGTEHILLGLIREQEGLAAQLLGSRGITIEHARGSVERVIGRGDVTLASQMPFSPHAKNVLELALRESLAFGDPFIGTEHILLGLLRQHESSGAKILADFGVELEQVRDDISAIAAGDPWRPRHQVDPYLPKSPPVAIEVVEELERRRSELTQALDADNIERASFAHERYDELVRATRFLERAWFGVPPREVSPFVGGSLPIAEHERASIASPTSRRERLLLAGGVLCGSAAMIGLVVGWLIWG